MLVEKNSIHKYEVDGYKWVKYDCGIHVFEKVIGDVILTIECTHEQLINNEFEFMVSNGITINKTTKYKIQKGFSK